MQYNGAQFMCSAIPINREGSAPACPEQCEPDSKVDYADLTDVVSYARFCLAACMPDGEQIGGTCHDVPAHMRDELESTGKTDPSELARPPLVKVPKELVAKKSEPELEAAQEADEAEIQKALADALASADDGGADNGGGMKEDPAASAMVAEAAGKRAQAAAMDARAAKAEALSVGVLANSSAALKAGHLRAEATANANAMLAAAAVRARVYAQSAKASMKRAEREVSEILEVPKLAAEAAATEAVKVLQEKTMRWRYEEKVTQERIAPQKPNAVVAEPITEAGEVYAAPFYTAMQNAMASRDAFEAKARASNEQAEDLQKGAQQLSAQAVSLQAAGRKGLAQGLIKRAQAMLHQAEVNQANAKQDYLIAQRINTGIPAYQQGAEAAAQRASALSRQKWMPPPPPPAAGGPAPAPAAAA